MDDFEDSSDDSTYKNGILIYFKKDGSKVSTPSVLPDGIITIGASIGNYIRIKLNDTRIQNVHCVIEVNESGIATIINKANKHPVTVNQTIVKHSKILRNDDIIEVVGKRFQYKNDYLTDQDIDAAIEKLSSLNKYSKKSSIPKSAIPRIVSLRKPPVVSKSTPISAISKRRLSLPVVHHSNFYSPAGKYNSPKASGSNAPITHSKSRSEIPSDESESLIISSYSSYSPIKEYTTSEIDTEDDVFIQTVSKNTSKLGDLSYKVNKHSKRFSSRKSFVRRSIRKSKSLTVAIEEILHHNESVTKTVEKLESKDVFVEMENGSFSSSRVSSAKNFSSSKTNNSQDEDSNEAEASFPSPTSTTGSRTNLPAAEYGSDDSEKSTSENFEYDDAEVSFPSNRTSVPIRSGRSIQRIETDQPENEDESNPETNVRPIKKSSIRQSNRTASEDVVKKFGLKNLSQLVVDDFLRVMADCDQSTSSNMSTHYSPISVSSLRRFQSGESEAEASPATKKAQNRSQARSSAPKTGSRRSTVPNNPPTKNNSTLIIDVDTTLDTNDSDALEETKGSFSSSKESPAKKKAQNRSQARSSAPKTGSRRSTGPNNPPTKNNSTLIIDVDTTLDTNDSDALEETKGSFSSSKESPARKKAQNRSQVRKRASRRSTVNKNLSENEDFDRSDAEVVVSPTRVSSGKKSVQNRSKISSTKSTDTSLSETTDASLTLATSMSQDDSEEEEVYLTATRVSSARKSAQNKSQIGSGRSTVNKNQSKVEDFGETDTDIDVSPTRSSQNRSKTVSKRSPVNKSTLRDYDTVDLNNSQDEDINEAETGISSTRTSSTRKTTHNKSRTSTTVSKKSDFEQSDLEVSLKPRKRSQVRKTVSTSAVEVNNSSISDYDELFAGMTTTKSTITNISVRKTGSDSVIVIEDTLSPIRSSSARKVQSTSRNNLTFDVSIIRISENAQTLNGTTVRVERTRPNISHVHTPGVRRRSADDSVDLSRSPFDQNLSSSKMSSVRKSKPSPNVRRSSRPRRSTFNEDYHYRSITNEDDATAADKYNSTTVPLNANKLVQFDESKLQLRRSSRPRRSTFNEDYHYRSITNEDDATAADKYNSTTVPLNANKLVQFDESKLQLRRSSRPRRSTFNEDYHYHSITNEDDATAADKYNSTTVPLNANKLVQFDESKLQLRRSSRPRRSTFNEDYHYASFFIDSGSNEDNATATNKYYSTTIPLEQEKTKTPGKSTVEDTVVDLSTPASPRGRRNQSTPYQSIMEDITPGTPSVDDSKMDLNFKTPFNTPQLFQDIRTSVLRSRLKISLSGTSKSPIRARESTSSTSGSNKRIKLPENNSSSSPQEVRVSLPNRMFSSLDVSETVSQKEPVKQTKKVQKSPKNDLTKIPNLRKIMSPKVQNSPNNDLSDVRGVKKLMRTPKVQKPPANDLSDVEGVSNIFNVSTSHRLSNASDIENNEDLFDRIFNKKAVKTYRSKSISPVKTLNASGNIRKSLGNLLEVNPRVLNWIEEQETLTERVNDQLKKKNRKEDVQYAAVSSTKRGAVNKIPKNGDESDSESPKINKDVVRRGRSKMDIEKVEDVEEKVQRGRKKVVKETLTKVDSPKPVRGRRKPIEKIEEIVEESADSPKSVTGRRRPVEEIEESEDSPRPVRGKRNIAKKIKEIAEDTERNRQKPKNLEEIEKTVEEPAADSPKPVRGRRKPIEKIEEIVEESADSPKSVTGRRRPVEEIEESEDSPRPVRGKRNIAKKIKEIAEDTERNHQKPKSLEEIEKTVEEPAADSPKPVRGRRKPIEKIEEIVEESADSPKSVTGRRRPVEEIEESVDSPRPVRGKRNIAKKIKEIAEDTERNHQKPKSLEEIEKTVEEPAADSPKPVRGRRRPAAKKLEEIEKTPLVDSPKPRGRRQATKIVEETKKTDEDVVADSPKPVRGRRNAAKSIKETDKVEEEATSSKRPLKKIEQESKSSNKEATELKKRGRRAEETDGEGQQPLKKSKRGKKAYEEDEEWNGDGRKESKKQRPVKKSKRRKKAYEEDEEWNGDGRKESKKQRPVKKSKRRKKAYEEDEDWNDFPTKKKTTRNRKGERKAKEDEVDEEEQQKPAKILTRGRKMAKIVEDSSEDGSPPAKNTRGKKILKKDEELDVVEPVGVSNTRSTRRKRVLFKI